MTMTLPTSTLSLLLLTLLTTTSTASATAPCTVCLNGQDSSYVDQSKAFTVPGLPVQTCGDLLSTVALFTQDSPICHSIQSVGTYCGCPRTAFACTLCENGTQPSHPLLELPNYNASDCVFGAPPDVKLNCETLDDVLNILANDTDPMCLQLRDDVGQTCGCPSVGDINTTTTINSTRSRNDTSTKNKPTIPTKTYQEPCTLCLDASATPLFPNRSLSLGSLPVHNCHDLTNFAGLLTATDIQCMGLQSLGPYCGCPVPPGACSLCPNGEAVPYPDRFAPLVRNFQGLPPGLVTELATDLTCGELASIVAVPPPSSIGAGIDPSLLCLVTQLRSGICGCTQGLRAKLITWFYRVSGMLSLVGSSSIIRDIVEKPAERRTTYHQLVFGISCFDIITSVAYVLTGILLPPSSGQYQAHGNHATCLLQGFMIQLGVTSVFYNLLLCVYFLLLVKYNWKEHRFRQYRNYVHLPILAIGIGLAGGCLPFIVPQLGFCYIAIPPESISRIAISFFFALPTSFALLLMIICSFLMCYHVFRTELRTLPKSITKRNLRLTRKVCWQSLFYCGIFVVTLPMLMVNYYVNFEGPNAFWQFLLSAFLAPSQGFWNSIIYFQRAHSFQRWKQVLCSCWPASSKEQGHTSDCHPTKPAGPGEGRSQEETANESQPSHEDIVHESDVTTDEEDGEESDLFSAPAAHWANEELPNPERHSSVEGTPNFAVSFRNLFRNETFRRTHSVPAAMNDDPQQLPTERDEVTDQDATGSSSETSDKRTSSAGNLFPKSESLHSGLNDNNPPVLDSTSVNKPTLS